MECHLGKSQCSMEQVARLVELLEISHGRHKYIQRSTFLYFKHVKHNYSRIIFMSDDRLNNNPPPPFEKGTI